MKIGTPENPIQHDWTKEDRREYRNTLCRESQRKRRKLAKRNGMCSICCSEPARPGRKTCQYCTDRAKACNIRREQMRSKA